MQDARDANPDARLHCLASQQHGAVAVSQALALGLSRKQLQRRVEVGVLRVVRRGVLAPAGSPPTWEQAALSAVLAAGEGAVLSHASAALVWGLRDIPADCIELSNLRNHAHRIADVRAHRFAVIEPDREVRRAMPVTSAARTLIDLSGREPLARLGVLLDDALRRKLTTISDLQDCVARLAPARGRRPRVMRTLLAARSGAFEPGESAFESRVLRALDRAGCPRPQVQFPLVVSGRTYRLDLAYPDERIAIELDGFEFHRTRTAFDVDRRRGNDIVSAGYVLLRFTWTMSDGHIVSTIRDALRRSPLVLAQKYPLSG